MDPIIAVFVFIASLFLLVKGADWLIENASKLGSRLHISPLIIGLTIVSLGTSLPEFFVSFFAVLSGVADMSVGNIVGSNIANIGLVIGVAAIIYPLVIKEETLVSEFPFLLVSAFLLLILSNDNNLFGRNTFTLGRFDGVILVLTLILFMAYIYRSIKTRREKKKVEKEYKEEFGQKAKHIAKDIFLLCIGIASLVIGAKLLVFSGSDIARSLGVSEKFIGLTIVAFGTSLPELFTSGMAAVKKNADIAVGNIIGSNILNILFVLGITAILKPFSVNPTFVYIDMVIMIGITFMFMSFAITKRTIQRSEGIILLLSYLAYIGYLVFML